jgi:large conductance mechanosensitive channel
VLDLAIGVIIGAAFGKIVASLVADIIMPPIGLALGGVSFTSLQILLQPAVVEGGKVVKEAVAIRYGVFIQALVDFVIIALVIFAIVRAIMRFQAKKVEVPAEPTADVVLLTEIRDLLKSQTGR